jgi:hypothetical protein
MTVAELIERLQQFPPEARVVTPGFDENGLDDVEEVVEVAVIFHDEKECGHYGRHEDAPDGTPPNAVYINH